MFSAGSLRHLYTFEERSRNSHGQADACAKARRSVKAWDIYTYDFDEAGPHPAVIVSHPDRVDRAPWVNLLICTSQRAARGWKLV